MNTTNMQSTIKYSFVTCAVAYLLVSLLAFVLFSTLFHGAYESIIDTRGMLGFLTLGLSDFSWWGNCYYLALPVPWITSSLVLIVLLYGIGGRSGRRLIFSGLSIFVYYAAMWLVFMVYGIFFGWGDMAYDLIWLWPICGFFVGVAVSAIVEKVFRPEAVKE